MRLLNLRHLCDQLRADALSEKQKFRFVLLLLALQFLRHGLEFLTYRPTANYLITLGIGALITLVGANLCFVANQRGDNRNFIERFICLSTVLALWYSVLYALIMTMGTYLFQWLTGIRQNWTDVSMIEIVVPSLTLIVYYAVLQHYVARTANGAVSPPNPAPIAAP